ncbi:MAG: hypothetical protein QNL63_14830, partial [Paracoccaceae bacterium]
RYGALFPSADGAWRSFGHERRCNTHFVNCTEKLMVVKSANSHTISHSNWSYGKFIDTRL